MTQIYIVLSNLIDARKLGAVGIAGSETVKRCARNNGRKRWIGYNDIVEREFSGVDNLEGIVDGVVFIGEAIVVFVNN